MDELYLLKKQLDELNKKIPKYEKDHGIETKEEAEYNSFLEKFIALGRKILSNDTLSDKDIKQVINTHAVQKVKTFLGKDNQTMFDSLSQLYEMSSDSMQFLEYCIIQSENDPWLFERDELFSEEREFLKQFTKKDITKFKNFSDYLKDIYSNESKKTIK